LHHRQLNLILSYIDGATKIALHHRQIAADPRWNYS